MFLAIIECTVLTALALAQSAVDRQNLASNKIRRSEKEVHSFGDLFGPSRSPHWSCVDHSLNIRLHLLITMIESDDARRDGVHRNHGSQSFGQRFGHHDHAGFRRTVMNVICPWANAS